MIDAFLWYRNVRLFANYGEELASGRKCVYNEANVSWKLKRDCIK